MSVGAAVSSVLTQYATFSGRARRSEYWWWYLVYSLVVGLPYVVGVLLLAGGSATAGDPETSELGGAAVAGLLVLTVAALLALALLLPSLAVTVRRLHDSGRSGWWYLVSLVPFGGFVLLVLTVMDSTPGHNRYGPDPRAVAGDRYGYGPAGYGPPSGYGQPGHGQPGHAPAGPDPRFGIPQA